MRDNNFFFLIEIILLASFVFKHYMIETMMINFIC